MADALAYHPHHLHADGSPVVGNDSIASTDHTWEPAVGNQASSRSTATHHSDTTKPGLGARLEGEQTLLLSHLR
jgi:hypothetical protein